MVSICSLFVLVLHMDSPPPHGNFRETVGEPMQQFWPGSFMTRRIIRFSFL